MKIIEKFRKIKNNKKIKKIRKLLEEDPPRLWINPSKTTLEYILENKFPFDEKIVERLFEMAKEQKNKAIIGMIAETIIEMAKENNDAKEIIKNKFSEKDKSLFIELAKKNFIELEYLVDKLTIKEIIEVIKELAKDKKIDIPEKLKNNEEFKKEFKKIAPFIK